MARRRLTRRKGKMPWCTKDDTRCGLLLSKKVNIQKIGLDNKRID